MQKFHGKGDRLRVGIVGPLVIAGAMLVLGACAHPAHSPVAGTEAPAEAPGFSQVHHTIDYIEIAVSDMAGAKQFYAAAFGWEFNDYGPDYAGIRRGKGEVGGLRLAPEVAPGGPLIILYSGDLEATLAGVRAAGGRISQAPYSFPGGRRFEFFDPSGNLLAVWSDR